MNIYKSEQIRNIAVLGHSGAGKSVLKEAILFSTGETDVVPDPDKNTDLTSDMNLFSVEWKGYKYNFVDTPGYVDFYSEVTSGVSAVAGAIIIVDGTADELEVGTDKALELTDELGIPKILFINKIDSEKANYYRILDQLREKYGKKIAPFHVPIGESDNFRGYVNVVELFAREYKRDEERCFTVEIPTDMNNEITEVRNMLMESVAESDESLLEKYFAGEEFSKDEVHMGLKKAVVNGEVIPVLCGSTLKNIGVHTLMWMAKDYFPSPLEAGRIEDDENFAGQVFKTIIDEHSGKLSILEVTRGKMVPNTTVYNVSKGAVEKISKIYSHSIGPLKEISEADTGDIVVIRKANSVSTGDTLSSDKDFLPYRELRFPKPQILSGIVPAVQSEKDKILQGLQKLKEEDKAFDYYIDEETGQMVVGGQGEIHLEFIKNKLKDKFNIDAELEEFRVPYRETIKSSSDVEVTFNKRTSDGHGQFAEVSMKFEPSDEVFVFEDEVFGGAVPSQYIPAVKKGIEDSLKKGVLGGYPVVGVKAVLYGGEYRHVDSSEETFKIAANMAFNKGMNLADPVLLEPVMKVKVSSPDEFIGDVMGDISRRRGKILGMELSDKSGFESVMAEVPQRELVTYLTDLRSLTEGRGFFDMEFLRYDEVPKKVTDAILKENEHEEE